MTVFGRAQARRSRLRSWVVVEGIAARPQDDPDVRIGQPFAVVVEGAPRVFQHLGDARYGNVTIQRRLSLVHSGRAERRLPAAGETDVMHGTVSVSDAAAGQADLAEHGGQQGDHPVTLFAVFRPLQRPAYAEQRAGAGHTAGKGPDVGGWNPRDARRPVGVLGPPVGASGQVGDEPLEADAIPAKERPVVKAVAVQRMRQAQHDGHIRVRPARPPVGAHKAGHVLLQRRHVHESRTRSGKPLELILRRMGAEAAVRDLGVLERDATEAHHQVRFPGDVVDGRRLHHQALEGHAQDVRDNHFGSAGRV